MVAADGRSSSPELKKAVISGLVDEGVHVIDLGLATTPFHYYSVFSENADGGMMITASHNMYQMNGIKFAMPHQFQRDDFMSVLRETAKRGIFGKNDVKGKITEQSDPRKYLESLVSRVDLSQAKDMKIVLDAGGGMTALFIEKLSHILPCKILPLNDGLYFDTGHPPLNPMKENSLASLKNAVVENRADFGVAFDPDGDRSGFVTANARYFRADYIGAFFAREILKKKEGATIVHDIRSSSIFRETITSSGGKAIESRVGHWFLKQHMIKQNAEFAVEMTGHFYFKETYFMESDFLPLLYFMQFLSHSGKSADQILDEFQIYPSSGEIDFPVKKDEHLLENIAGHFKDAREMKWIDGLTIYFDEWWANIRMSVTQPLIRLNVEARTKVLLDTKVEELKKLITDP
jgi:phosphomannomutase